MQRIFCAWTAEHGIRGFAVRFASSSSLLNGSHSASRLRAGLARLAVFFSFEVTSPNRLVWRVAVLMSHWPYYGATCVAHCHCTRLPTYLPGSIGGKSGVKWNTLEHAGVLFPPEYEPHGVKMLYDGEVMTVRGGTHCLCHCSVLRCCMDAVLLQFHCVAHLR